MRKSSLQVSASVDDPQLKTDVEKVAENSVDISTVATSIDSGQFAAAVAAEPEIAIVAQNISEVVTLASVAHAMDALNSSLSNINAVAMQLGEVNNISTHMATLLLIELNLTKLLRIESSLDAIDTVNSNMVAVNSTYEGMPDIVAVVANMPSVVAVEGMEDYLLKYAGAYGTSPTVRLDGSSLQDGDYYFDVTVQAMVYYTGSSWFVFDIADALTAIEVAELAETNAKVSETNSKASEEASSVSEVNAKDSENIASQAALEASQDKVVAQESAVQAQASAEGVTAAYEACIYQNNIVATSLAETQNMMTELHPLY